MATTDRRELIKEFKEGEEARRDFADEYVDAAIALQIKVLRQQREWTQARLGEKANLGQSQISMFENVNNSSWTVATLKRIAAALELPLLVSFGSWGELLDQFSRMGRSQLERPRFENDPAMGEGSAHEVLDNVILFPQANFDESIRPETQQEYTDHPRREILDDAPRSHRVEESTTEQGLELSGETTYG